MPPQHEIENSKWLKISSWFQVRGLVAKEEISNSFTPPNQSYPTKLKD